MKYKLLLLLLMLFTSTFLFAQSPTDGAHGVGLTPSFTFAAPTTVNNEWIQIATNTGFSPIFFETNLGAAPIAGYTYGGPALNNGTTYYWRIVDNSATLMEPLTAPNYYTFQTVFVSPSTQAHDITFSSVATSSMQISWTNGSGTNRAVFMKLTSAVESASPVDGNLYTTPNAHFGYGDQIGSSGWYCVYNGTGSGPITVDNLAAGYTYRVMVCEYNGDTGTPSTIVYNTTTATNNPKNQLTLYSVPTTQAHHITFSSVAANSMQISWTNGSGTNRAAFMKLTSAIESASPVDGNLYTTPNAHFGYGDQIGSSGWYCIYNGTSSGPITVDNLAAGYTYRIMVCEYNGDTGTPSTIVYNTATATNNPMNQITLPAAAVLSSPVNGLTGVSILPTLIWGSVTGAASYRVYVSTNNDCSSPLFSTNVGAVTTYTFDATISGFPLTNGTIYYWKVAAVNGSGEGTSSSIYHFTTFPTMVTYLSNPYDGSTVYTTSNMFAWYTGQLTTGLTFILQYKYGSTPTNESWWSDATTVQTTNINYTATLLAGKTYYWRVLIRETSPSVVPYDYVYYPAYNVYNTFITSGGTSVTCYPSWPTGSSTIYTNSPTLYWYLDQYATGLKFQVAYNTTGAQSGGVLTGAVKSPAEVDVITLGSGNLYKTLSLSPGTTYSWQVRAYYAAGDIDSDPTNGPEGWSPWSSIVSFTTNGTGTLFVPIPSYPTSGVTVYTTAPYFYWYLGAYSTGLYYEIEYDLAANPLTGTADVTTSTADQLYLLVSGLTPGGSYHYKVRSKDAPGLNAGNHSNWSDEATFSVAGGNANTYPVLTWPLYNATVYTTTPTLYWYLEGSSIGLTGYTLKYKKDSTPGGGWFGFTPGSPDASDGQITITPATTTYKTLTVPLTYGGHYYWAVATSAAASDADYQQGEFTVIGPSVIGDPILSQPSDGSIVYSTTVTFSWYMGGSTIGIDNYSLVFSTSDVFESSVTTTRTVTAQSRTETSLLNGDTYYWKVRANYLDGTHSNWVGPWSFTINPGSFLVQPIVGSPNNVSLNTTTPMLSWALPAKTAATAIYEVQLADNPNFTAAKTFNSNKSYVNVNGLNAGKGYFWKVRSIDNFGAASNYSGTGQFKVNNTATAVEEIENIPTNYTLEQNYPNPFNPSTLIKFALPQNSRVTIKIYDMLGREVKTLVSEEMSAGIHSTYWNGENNLGNKVVSGTYLYRISAGNFVSTKKMVLIK